jgi:hypothetical protein
MNMNEAYVMHSLVMPFHKEGMCSETVLVVGQCVAGSYFDVGTGSCVQVSALLFILVKVSCVYTTVTVTVTDYLF